MADFTGFNPMDAKTNIGMLESELTSAYIALSDAFNVIENDVSENWASPNAVQFATNYVPKFNELKRLFAERGNSIMNNSVQAVNYMAMANGTSFSVEVVELKFTENTNNFKEEINGIVGMNVEKVVNLIEGEFEAQLSKFYTICEELKTLDIALYDPEGTLKESYRAFLSSFEQELNETVHNIYTILAAAINTEINAINISKTSAADEMAAN